MNYTEKYHLPQWEETDRIMRVDFNQMCADIDEGITTAQETAEALPYVVGHYAGDRTANREIVLGFRPSFVIVTGTSTGTGANPTMPFAAYSLLTAGGLMEGFKHRLRFTDNGFIVQGPPEENYVYPALNEVNRFYDYIAFR